jgi:hypothetical protein
VLSTIANDPSPPVLLPSPAGSSNSQPPLVPSALVTVQPCGGAVEESNASVGPVRRTA